MSAADWASRYLERFGFALTPLHGKAPYRAHWNDDEQLIRTPGAAREHWRRHPQDGIGMCLGPSGLVSLDCDDVDAARAVLAAEGIDLDKLIETTPTIVGRAPRLEFRAPGHPQLSAIAVEMLPTLKAEAKKRQEAASKNAPRVANGRFQPVPPETGEGVAEPHSGEATVQAAWIVGLELGRKAIVWPARAEGEKPITVLELRAGRVQDVLPPSMHPETHRPYRWLMPPRDGFPPLPDALLSLWLGFDEFRRRARALCPWAAPEPQEHAPIARRSSPYTGPSIIAAFNDAHSAAAILEAHGYEPAGRRRWKSPNGHGVAGVTLLPSGRVYCHHASDALGDEHAHDAFDLFALLDHHGDQRAAVRAAAELLELNRRVAA
ncbi:MAG: bifunctional DNA primase/polymerase [Steroidobacteraceae bacterium]